ncbi:MAG: DEAD/DEAH box helicase, partial [Chloroflexi bacterium]|nr:DEAD/DEAH box helicase [Chloroflexota bacterium]
VIGSSLPPSYKEHRDHFTNYLKTQSPLDVPLLDLQKKSVAAATAMKYSAIWDDMGLGKTAQALAKNELGNHDCTLILCPNNVKKVWVAEIEKFLGIRSNEIFVGKGADLINLPAVTCKKYRFIIFNYEALVVAGKYPKITPSVFTACTHHILDEAHAIRNAFTARFEVYFYHLLNNPADSLTLLTGTPIDRCINEVWPYMALIELNPHKKENDFFQYFPNLSVFSDRYAHASNLTGSIAYRGYQKQPFFEIKNIMGPKVIQRKIEEVVELPKLYTRDIMIPDHLFQEDMELIKNQFATAFHRVQSKVKLLDALERGVLEEAGDKALKIVQKIRSNIAIQKVVWTVDMAIKYFKFTGPTIIFSEFIEPLNEIGRLLKEQGYSSVKAIGKGMKMAEREWNIKDFKAGKHEFLLATFGAMSEGENLQYSQNIIFNDLSWQPLVIKQATRRVWRIGQDKECHVIQMLCSADAVVQRIVSSKQEMVGQFEQFLVDIKEENGYI